MPFVIDSGADQFIAGMKRQRIIDAANKRTGGVAGDKLDLNLEFLSAIQDFCLERQWWWRKKTVTLDTLEGTNVYDMAGPNSPVFALDCQRMIKVQFFPTNGQVPMSPTIIGQPQKMVIEVPPLFEDDHIQIAMEDDLSTGPPQSYFLVPGSSSAIQLSPIPDDAYHLRLNFWAVPNGTIDTLDDLIPLVPAYLHHLLITKLELGILSAPVIAAMPGMSGALVATQAKYDRQIALVIPQRDFADGRVRSFTNTESAIRGTR